MLERYKTWRENRKGKGTQVSVDTPEVVKHYSDLSEVLKKINENLVDVTDQGGTIKRIISPFEARIDKSSITKKTLERIGSLPIEVGLVHDANGDLILNTGAIRSASMYDYGHIEVWVPGKNLEMDNEIYAQHETFKLLKERNFNSPNYTAHNHPSGSLRPSLSDLNFFSRVKIKKHFILTKDGVCVLNTDFDEEKMRKIKEYSSGPGAEIDFFKKPEYDVFLKSLNVIEKVVMFDDPEIETVIAELKK